MFTGIVREIGEVLEIEDLNKGKRFVVSSEVVLVDQMIGDSIAVDGACHTILKIAENKFEFESIPETLKLTNLDAKKVGDKVNLEAAMKMSDRIDGHIVLGHVDTKIKLLEVREDGDYKVLRFELLPDYQQYIAQKGSVALNGVSLTVSAVGEDYFEVSLISHTWEFTNLKFFINEGLVNLEIDPLARYVERMLNNR